MYEMDAQGKHENSENGCLLWRIRSENDFETVLATFCYHDYSVNAS